MKKCGAVVWWVLLQWMVATGIVLGESSMPVYVTHLGNVNDFSLFANGGWDGNWYVGFNTCWVTKFNIATNLGHPADFKAFIGAKLGRAKTKTITGRPPWEREAIPGEIYIAVASTPSWPATNRFLLTTTKDIPVEGDPENALDGVGESRWFWTEVPVEAIAFGGPNYLALYSSTPGLVSASSSPVLAAGWGLPSNAKIGGSRGEAHTWLNTAVSGAPPSNPEEALKTGVTYFEPAIGIKLVRLTGNDSAYIDVSLDDIKQHNLPSGKITVVVKTVAALGVERVWIETSGDGDKWSKAGRYLWNPPYIFTINVSLDMDKMMLRAAASDLSETIGYSEPAVITKE